MVDEKQFEKEVKNYTRVVFAIPVTFFIILMLMVVPWVSHSMKKVSSGDVRQVVKIGAILPLSGDASIAGENTRNGINLASQQIKEFVLEIIYEDTEADPKKGVNAVNKLIKHDNVPYIIDDSISSVTLAVAPICEKNERILLATGASAPSISEAGDFIFRIWNSDTLEGESVALYARQSLGLDKVAIFHVNNDFGIGLQKVFRNAFEKHGGSVVSIESFETGEIQYRTQLTKIKKEAPEAIYLVGYSKDCILIIQQAKELGFSCMWLGTSVMLDKNVTTTIQNASYDLYYPVPELPDPCVPSVKHFKEAYTAKYGESPPALADVGYDAAMLFVEAAKLGGGYDSKHVHAGLKRIKGFSGASGLITFDKNGDVNKPISIRRLGD